jgi:uncharacterized protein YhdP
MVRKVLVSLALVAAVAMVALALFARGVIGGDAVRRTLEAQLSARLGQPVRIGSLGASFIPRVTLDLHDVSVGGQAGTTIARISVATGLRGLLSRRVEDAEIIISDSRVPLETAFGIMGAAATGGPSTSGAGLTILSIRALTLRNVELLVGSRSVMVDLQSSITGDRLDVARLVAGFAGTRLEARGTLTSIAGRKGAFTANADRLNLDEVLAVASGLPGPAAPGPSAVDVSVELTAPGGRLGGYAFDKLSSTVRITPGRLAVQPLRFGLFGGGFDGQLRVTPARGAADIALGGRVEGMNVSTILREAGGSSSMSGRLSGSFAVTASGAESGDLLRTARGTGRATIVDGEIPGLDMVRSIVLAFGKPSGTSAGTGARFTRIAGTFTLADQMIRSEDIAFASPDFDMHGRASVRMPSGAVDMHANVVLSPALTAQAGTDLRRYAQEDGRVVLPATITGTVAEPAIRLDVAAAANRAIQNEVKRKFKGLLDRIIK